MYLLKREMFLRQLEQAVIVVVVVLTNLQLFCAHIYISQRHTSALMGIYLMRSDMNPIFSANQFLK